MTANYWEFCDHCERDVLICGTCGNNCCNGGHGEVDGKPCSDCNAAYAEQAKGNPTPSKGQP
jgi:hypothetical protein